MHKNAPFFASSVGAHPLETAKRQAVAKKKIFFFIKFILSIGLKSKRKFLLIQIKSIKK